MLQFDKYQYEDEISAFERLRTKIRELDSLYVMIGLDYVRKIADRLTDDRLFRVRDSGILRLQGILFHLEWLNAVHSPTRKIQSPSYNAFIGDQIGLRQDFIFDSIVFQASSFADYMGCLLAYVVYGKDRAQWQAMANKSRADQIFERSSLAKAIDELDRDLIAKLNDYRGDLIHYKDDQVGVSQSYDLINNIADIKVHCPSNFFNRFKKELGSNNDIPINWICLWLVENLSIGAVRVGREALNYIEENGKVEKGKEIISFPSDTQS